jgi:DNA-binding transcriptional LysR family regulator
MERKADLPLRRSEDAPLGLAVPHVEHRELRYFVAVAEELHFTHAAERLEMSQPPLSAAIAHLESKLGTRLFERDSRNVRLTSSGVALLQRAKSLLRQMDDAVDAARQAENGSVTRLRLVADTVSRASVVPALTLALERADGRFEIKVEELIPAAMIPAVRAGEADVAVYVGDGHHSGVRAALLRSVAPVALFQRSHPLAGRKRVRLAELAEHRLALWPEEQAPDTHKLVRTIFAGVELRAGISILPMFSGVWAEELADGAFCVLPADTPIVPEYVSAAIAGTSLTFDTWLLWNESAQPELVDAIRAATAALNGRE